MAHIEIDNSQESLPDFTISAMRKNMEELGQQLENEILKFEQIVFEIIASYAPSMLELATPSIRVLIYSESHWMQIMLVKARPVTLDEVRSWWDKHNEPRFGDGCRHKAAKTAEPQKKSLDISLDDLGL